ncbi:MAG: hypothetical protein D6820_00450, partial [Lentisphaerae bacterium]
MYLRSMRQPNYIEVQRYFMERNWPAFRGWGLSAILPWDQSSLWQPDPQSEQKVIVNPKRWEGLERPGIVPDRFYPNEQWIYHPSSHGVIPTSLGKAFLRWNQPRIAFLAGKEEHFTEKSHQFACGEVLRKTVVMVNDSRSTALFHYRLNGDWGWEQKREVKVQPGRIARVSYTCRLPNDPGKYTITFEATDEQARKYRDTFTVHVRPRLAPGKIEVDLYDPANTTAKLFDRLGIVYRKITTTSSQPHHDILVIGREAIDLKTSLPWLKNGNYRRVLILEQRSEVLQNRLGFRIQEYAVRHAFIRTPDHPVLKGLDDAWFSHWRGSATLLPPYLPDAETDNPHWFWCGFRNTRVWRAGNVGTVASVLIEKPSTGNFMPLLDCGFDLQYSPLLEYDDSAGTILFSQLDITGSSASEPAAATVLIRM